MISLRIKPLAAYGLAILPAAVAAVVVLGMGARTAAAARVAQSVAYFQLVQYPSQAGLRGFYSQIEAAKRSIDMEIYELSDPTAEHELAKAAARGVAVRVLLDRDYSGAEVNAAAYTYLRAHGVRVRWAPARYIFHIKATTFDGRTADVSTANLTAAYYATTRDAEVVDTDPTQVKAITHTLANDWAAAPGGSPRDQTVPAPGLDWSPSNAPRSRVSAEAEMVAQITAAKKVVDFESEELSDSNVYRALAADARRGVSCRIVMTDSSQWRKAFAAVAKAGCQVRVFPDTATALYIHEKFVLDDPGTGRESLLIGSQNASWYSLHENRELDLLIHDAHGGKAVIGGVAGAFQSDFSQATSWH